MKVEDIIWTTQGLVGAHAYRDLTTNFSLNAFVRILSTSVSRWKAVASRLSSFSISASVAEADDEPVAI